MWTNKADWPDAVVGNDDPTVNEPGVGNDEDDNPADEPKGELWESDDPRFRINNADGALNETVELRAHYRDFVRIELGGKWFVASDYAPWRVHTKATKLNLSWADDGSSVAQDNAGW